MKRKNTKNTTSFRRVCCSFRFGFRFHHQPIFEVKRWIIGCGSCQGSSAGGTWSLCKCEITPGKPTDIRPFYRGYYKSTYNWIPGPPCSYEWNQKKTYTWWALGMSSSTHFRTKTSETKKNIATWKLISIQILTFESLWECHLTAWTPFVHRVFVVFAFGLTSPRDKTNMF